MIDTLIEDGFFETNKKISDITDYCKKRYAYTYSITDFSPALGRAIRSDKLKRITNAEKQYEYS
jgi:hypothetical protein